MFKKLRSLTAPFAFSATSFILVIAIALPGHSYPFEQVMALSADSESVILAPAGLEEALEEEPVTETFAESDAAVPVRAETPSALKESAPPSAANALADKTPRMESDLRAEAYAENEDVDLGAECRIPYFLDEEEYDLLCWCVEGEAHGKSFEHRVIITQVVFNRVFNDRFPGTVKQVLLSPGQFDPMVWYNAGYVDKFVTPLTREAVDAVMNGGMEDLSQGALYFCNPQTAHGVEWFDNCLKTLFEFENHRFYTTK